MSKSLIKYQIKTLSPIIISTLSGNRNITETEKFIPSSNITGALAFMHIDNNKLKKAHEDPDFHDWFLSGKLRISGAYYTADGDVHLPCPNSVQSDKDKADVYYDLMFVDEEFEEQTKKLNKFVYIKNGTNIVPEEISTVIFSHHQRDPEKGTSAEGILYDYEAISPGQTFTGYISADDPLLDKFINHFKETKTVYLGRSKNAQYGKAEISISSEKKDPKKIFFLKSQGSNDCISLYFYSDVILKNKNGFSVADTKELEGILRDQISSDLRIIKSFVRTKTVENYVSVLKMKKSSDISFAAGSCFLIQLKEFEKFLEKFYALIQEGLGERIHEGFGWVMFGLQNNSGNLTYIPKQKDQGLSLPDPNHSKAAGILHYLIRQTIEEKMRLDAYQNAGNVKRCGYLTKSLISRLEACVMRNCITKRDFNQFIDSLKKPAKEKLDKARFGHQTLFEYLYDYKFDHNDFNNIVYQMNKLNIAKLIDYCHYTPDENFHHHLYQIYLQTFFIALRKIIKAGKGG